MVGGGEGRLGAGQQRWLGRSEDGAWAGVGARAGGSGGGSS